MGAAMPLTPMAYYSQSYSVPSRTGSGIPTSNLNKGATFKTLFDQCDGSIQALPDAKYQVTVACTEDGETEVETLTLCERTELKPGAD